MHRWPFLLLVDEHGGIHPSISHKAKLVEMDRGEMAAYQDAELDMD